MAELLAERGVVRDPVYLVAGAGLWAELDRRCRHHFKRTDKSDRLGGTCIKVKGNNKYLYRSVDSCGQTIGFCLPPQECGMANAFAAKR